MMYVLLLRQDKPSNKSKKQTRCNFIQNISKDVRFIQVHKQKAINAIKFRKKCVLYCEEPKQAKRPQILSILIQAYN